MPNALYLLSAAFLAGTTASHIFDSREAEATAQTASPRPIHQAFHDTRANVLTTSETEVLRSTKVERWVF